MFGIQAIVQSKGPVFGFFLVILLKGSEYWTIQTPYHSKPKQVRVRSCNVTLVFRHFTILKTEHVIVRF